MSPSSKHSNHGGFIRLDQLLVPAALTAASLAVKPIAYYSKAASDKAGKAIKKAVPASFLRMGKSKSKTTKAKSAPVKRKTSSTTKRGGMAPYPFTSGMILQLPGAGSTAAAAAASPVVAAPSAPSAPATAPQAGGGKHSGMGHYGGSGCSGTMPHSGGGGGNSIVYGGYKSAAKKKSSSAAKKTKKTSSTSAKKAKKPAAKKAKKTKTAKK